MTHIDWLSLTCAPLRAPEQLYVASPAREIDALKLRFGAVWDQLNSASEWVTTHPRAPFNRCWDNGHGVLIFASPSIKYILVEVQGQGCAWLMSQSLLIPIMQSALARITRIDVAVDIVCDTEPEHILARGYNQRFLSRTSIQSESGDTEYIGSLKADRFCRIYRFSPPHPRANTLRVEFVNRRHVAKAVATRIIDRGLPYVASALMIDYGIQSSFVLIDGAFVTVDYPPANRCSMVTEGWLIKQVAPSFKKLVKKGVIPDPIAWLNKYFME